jgi:hypothetical protein
VTLSTHSNLSPTQFNNGVFLIFNGLANTFLTRQKSLEEKALAGFDSLPEPIVNIVCCLHNIPIPSFNPTRIPKELH